MSSASTNKQVPAKCLRAQQLSLEAGMEPDWAVPMLQFQVHCTGKSPRPIEFTVDTSSALIFIPDTLAEDKDFAGYNKENDLVDIPLAARGMFSAIEKGRRGEVVLWIGNEAKRFDCIYYQSPFEYEDTSYIRFVLRRILQFFGINKADVTLPCLFGRGGVSKNGYSLVLGNGYVSLHDGQVADYT